MTRAIMTSASEVWEYLGDSGDESVCVSDRFGNLYLVYMSHDEQLCYQGVPQAADEKGSGVESNNGRLDLKMPILGPLAKVWPVHS